jgi:Asp-tRNA(Asn)/Glu-tRNA(Gln) amidotransferase A subunit family amidase
MFGVPEGPYLERASPEGLKHFREICGRLAAIGMKIISVEMLKNLDEVEERHKKLVAAEAAIVHRRWFQDYSTIYHEKTARLIREGQKINPGLLKACRSNRQKLRAQILKTMERHHLSALLAPAAVGPAPKGLGDTGDQIMNLPWSNAGLPAISLPCGASDEGLPMGLQMIGSWMGDENLLSLADRIAGYLD